ncbi:MAG: hypothetical protein WAN76_05885, partial [Candidatus Sulfotelmatobacter sp.]
MIDFVERVVESIRRASPALLYRGLYSTLSREFLVPTRNPNQPTLRLPTSLIEKMAASDGVEPPTPAFSELVFPVFPTTSKVAVGLLNT